jgi:hypothetical protein
MARTASGVSKPGKPATSNPPSACWLAAMNATAASTVVSAVATVGATAPAPSASATTTPKGAMRAMSTSVGPFSTRAL